MKKSKRNWYNNWNDKTLKVFYSGLMVGILFTGIVVIGLLISTRNSEFNDFVIYKQECNEKIQGQFSCSDGTYYIDTIGCFENLRFFNTKSGVECLREDKILESCKKVKVETFTNPKFCVDKYGDSNNARWCIMGKYINKRWLENNCDVCHDYICISKSENTNISVIEFANEELKFYRCGNYTIILK